MLVGKVAAAALNPSFLPFGTVREKAHATGFHLPTPCCLTRQWGGGEEDGVWGTHFQHPAVPDRGGAGGGGERGNSLLLPPPAHYEPLRSPVLSLSFSLRSEMGCGIGQPPLLRVKKKRKQVFLVCLEIEHTRKTCF